MKKFLVYISQSAREQFSSFEPSMQKRLKKSMQNLSINPFSSHSGCDIKKLNGNLIPPLYRLRVGDARALYSVQGTEVKITEIIKRKEGYNFLD
ncbi:MAG: type II toxin-antitoxin system RelE/ParE family toxin [Candidatus Micrarchaeota archaeon]